MSDVQQHEASSNKTNIDRKNSDNEDNNSAPPQDDNLSPSLPVAPTSLRDEDIKGTNDAAADARLAAAGKLATAAAAGRARAEESRNDPQQNSSPTAKANQEPEENSDRCWSMDRLVACSGFGRLHVVQVTLSNNNNNTATAKPQRRQKQSIRKLTKKALEEVLPTSLSLCHRQDDDESNATSLTNSCSAGPFLKCWASIAPIISPSTTSATITDRPRLGGGGDDDRGEEHHPKGSQPSSGSAKKRKDVEASPRRGGEETEPSSSSRQQVVTHYVVQLDPHEGMPKCGSSESLSSSDNMGLSKADNEQEQETNLEEREAVDEPHKQVGEEGLASLSREKKACMVMVG